MSFFLAHQGHNLWHGKFSLFPDNIAVHAVSTRQGGFSRPPYDSLNMALHVGDNPDDVWKNRQLFLHSLGLKAEMICTPQQVHGSEVRRVTKDDAGRGSCDYDDALPDTDALVTNEAGLPLMLCFADCVPILLLDLEHQAVGIAHGGWKGTLAGIAAKTVATMTTEFGTVPEECLAAIGPSIGPCCFEVSDDVAENFRASFSAEADKIVHAQVGTYHIDLWEANRRQLLGAGLLPANIDSAATCTCCQHQWYYSYRAAKGSTGRIAAVIALRPW